LATRIGLAELPEDVGWRHVHGTARLAGIGFTMSLFIADLAFDDDVLLGSAEVGILAASVITDLAGYALLRGASGPTP